MLIVEDTLQILGRSFKAQENANRHKKAMLGHGSMLSVVVN